MRKFINDLRTRVTRSAQWECKLCEGRLPVKVTRWVWVTRCVMWAAVGMFVYKGVRSMGHLDYSAADVIYWWVAASLAAGLALYLHLLRDAEGKPGVAPREAVPEVAPVGLNMADREINLNVGS